MDIKSFCFTSMVDLIILTHKLRNDSSEVVTKALTLPIFFCHQKSMLDYIVSTNIVN